ncbi:MAG: DUF211 domain-containing protein [Candidatus Hadarchaeota archaeon]
MENGGIVKKSSDKKIGKLVLDVLKPHDPGLPEFTTRLGALEGVDGVDVVLVEIDRNTDTLRVTLEGHLDYPNIRSAIEEWGAVVQSVDEVSIGSVLPEKVLGPKHRHKGKID